MTALDGSSSGTLDGGDLPTVERVAKTLERIAEWQPHINAYITVAAESAMEDARRIDEARARGESLPLDGLILAIKDDIDVAGLRGTVGSAFHTDRIASEDAEVVSRLRRAGGVIIGKLGMHEWAYGATSNNPHYGTIRNPWDTARIPGGSSGGSGAALAADLCDASIGSDAGGSVRIPASLCGVAGLRPTLGSVSGRGTFPICYSLETLGVLSRDLRAIAAVMAVIAGFDPEDPHSVDHRLEDPMEGLDAGLEGIRVAAVKGFFADGLDPEVDSAVSAAVEKLAAAGASVSDVVLDLADDAYQATSTMIVRAEALAIHAGRVADHPELYGEDVLRRLELGREITGVELALATETVRSWRAAVLRTFHDYDLLITAATPHVAPPIEGLEMIATTQQLTRMTFPVSGAGTPALSIPVGFTAKGLPIGAQLIAAPWRDAMVLRAAAAYQRMTDWHKRRPAPPHGSGANRMLKAGAAQ